MNLPDFVQIEPVGQCNLACRMCPVTYRDAGAKPPAFMSFDAFLPRARAVSRHQAPAAAGHGRAPPASAVPRHGAPRRGAGRSWWRAGLAKLHVSTDAADPAAYE
jgi:hypothetical protein